MQDDFDLLIVGGGIRNKESLQASYAAGADIVVIGTAFEQDENFLDNLLPRELYVPVLNKK